MHTLSFTKLQVFTVTCLLKRKPTDEYKASLSNATAFKLKYPEEKATTAAQIYNVNKNNI